MVKSKNIKEKGKTHPSPSHNHYPYTHFIHILKSPSTYSFSKILTLVLLAIFLGALAGCARSEYRIEDKEWPISNTVNWKKVEEMK